MKRELLPLLIFLILCAFSVWLYPNLPETVPTHFDMHGNADGWMPRAQAAVAAPIGALVLYIFLSGIILLNDKAGPDLRLDDSGKRVLANIKAIMILMMLLLQISTYLYTQGFAQAPIYAVAISLSLLFIYIGIEMKSIKRNHIMGARLPWTLADDDNWRKTNTLAGKLFIVIGILMLLLAKWPIAMFIVILGGTITASIAIIIYSWRLSKQKT